MRTIKIGCLRSWGFRIPEDWTDRVAQLVTKLIALNRTLDIDRAASDKEYRKKLMTELGI